MSVVRSGHAAARLAGEVQEMFLRAVRLEERPETVQEAATGLYSVILEKQATHAPGGDQSRHYSI